MALRTRAESIKKTEEAFTRDPKLREQVDRVLDALTTLSNRRAMRVLATALVVIVDRQRED